MGTKPNYPDLYGSAVKLAVIGLVVWATRYVTLCVTYIHNPRSLGKFWLFEMIGAAAPAIGLFAFISFSMSHGNVARWISAIGNGLLLAVVMRPLTDALAYALSPGRAESPSLEYQWHFASLVLLFSAASTGLAAVVLVRWKSESGGTAAEPNVIADRPVEVLVAADHMADRLEVDGVHDDLAVDDEEPAQPNFPPLRVPPAPPATPIADDDKTIATANAITKEMREKHGVRREVMNKRQLIAMWVGVVTLCLMLIFPPWRKNGWGYYPIFIPPSGYYRPYTNEIINYQIDWTRLSMQMTVVVILTITSIITLKKRS